MAKSVRHRDNIWVTAAILALVVAVIVLQRRLHAYEHYVDESQALITRSTTMSNLIGGEIPSLVAVTIDNDTINLRPTDAHHLVWVLDPRECLGCLTDINTWNRLSHHPDIITTVVLVGVDLEEAREIVFNTKVRGRVVYDPGGVVFDSLQLELASTKVFALRDGVVVFADSRPLESACSWKVEDVVAKWWSIIPSGFAIK